MAFLPTNMNWGSLGKALDSKTGQLGLNTLFGTLANKGQEDLLNKQSQQQYQNSSADRMANIYQQGQQDKLTRDQSMLSAAPTGWDQQYLQQQLGKYLAYDRLMNGGNTLPVINKDVKAKLDAAGYKPYTPSLGAGWETGENPFGRGMSEQSVLGRYNTLSQAGGGANYIPDFAKLFGAGENADYANQQASAFNKGQYNNQYGQGSLLQQAIDGEKAQLAATQQQQKKKSGGWLSKIGGFLKAAAPIAASFIPGVGPALGAAIGAGAGAIGSKMQGQSWGSSIGNAALGGLAGYAGNKLFNGQGTPAGGNMNMSLLNPGYGGSSGGNSSPIQQALGQPTNPNLFAQMYGRQNKAQNSYQNLFG